MTRPGWGVLGTGGIARKQTADLVREGFDVVAVGSRSAESAAAFAGSFGLPRAHGDYEALVHDPEVSVVYVATPQAYHLEHASLAIAAGKHVLLEKPFTLNAAQAEQLVVRAREAGVVLMEAMWTRFLPHMVRAQELISSGILGKLVLFSADSTQRLPHGPLDRLGRPDEGGGSLLDVGIYPVSVSSWLFGQPSSIQATGALSGAGVDLHTTATLGHSDGAVSVCVSSIDGAGPNRATLIGTEARIEFERAWYAPTAFSVIGEGERLLERYDRRPEGRGMHLQAVELERVIADGRTESATMPLDETVAIMRTLDAIRGQTGAAFPVD